MTQQEMRIINGKNLGKVPLESAKSFATRLLKQWPNNEIKIAYSDLNTHQEQTYLYLKIIEGAKTAHHPQLVLYIKGAYHVETLNYYSSARNPFDWQTWIEAHVDLSQILFLLYPIMNASLIAQDYYEILPLSPNEKFIQTQKNLIKSV